MISIIICSRIKDILSELRDNIEQTIGVDHEIIVIDNSGNEYTIFTAYNKGVELSRFPIVLFMHDDILYKTENWGVKVLAYFKDEKVGGIGIAGTPYLPIMTGGWWSTGAGYLHVLQPGKKNSTPELLNFFPESINSTEVVALDGVWFCLRKSLFDKIRFDDVSFKGFHLYDLDITLQAYHLGAKLLCINDILIYHSSHGILDKNWIHNLFIFQNKWKNVLPVSCISFNLKKQCIMEYRVLNTFISDQIRTMNGSRKKKSGAYLFAIKQLLRFKKGYLYIKTPYWLSKLFLKYIGSLFK